MSGMRRASNVTVAALAAALTSSATRAADPDEDRTPLADCDTLPASASIEVFTNAQTRTVCQELVRILEGATISDLRGFSKAAYILSRKGYEPNEYAKIAHVLVDIIRLRGLFDNEPRWSSSNQVVWGLWIAEKGLISPVTIRDFLAAAGPDDAKAITDDTLAKTMITLAVAHKNGIDLNDVR